MESARIGSGQRPPACITGTMPRGHDSPIPSEPTGRRNTRLVQAGPKRRPPGALLSSSVSARGPGPRAHQQGAPRPRAEQALEALPPSAPACGVVDTARLLEPADQALEGGRIESEPSSRALAETSSRPMRFRTRSAVPSHLDQVRSQCVGDEDVPTGEVYVTAEREGQLGGFLPCRVVRARASQSASLRFMRSSTFVPPFSRLPSDSRTV